MTESSSKLRVLVVDDDVRVADSLAKILLANGYEAVAAYSAESAMRLAGKMNPDAVISDVVMGPVSGIELANFMRDNYPNCRVLLISGHASKRDALERQSPVQILAKPIAPEKVLEFVDNCAAKAAAAVPHQEA